MSQFLTEYNRQASRASFPAWAVSPTSPRTRYFVPRRGNIQLGLREASSIRGPEADLYRYPPVIE